MFYADLRRIGGVAASLSVPSSRRVRTNRAATSHDRGSRPADTGVRPDDAGAMDHERLAAYHRRLRPDDLRGANLRYCLLTLLADAGTPRSIGELLDDLARRGLRVGGADPHKTISDVLRYECGLGRARRVARGRFIDGYRPDTTVRRHRSRLHDLVGEAARRRRSNSS